MAQAKGSEFIVNFWLNIRAGGQTDINPRRGYLDKQEDRELSRKSVR